MLYDQGLADGRRRRPRRHLHDLLRSHRPHDRPARRRGRTDAGRGRAGAAALAPFRSTGHNRIMLVDVKDIGRLEGEGHYTNIIATGDRYLSNLSMSVLESRLDPARFPAGASQPYRSTSTMSPRSCGRMTASSSPCRSRWGPPVAGKQAEAARPQGAFRLGVRPRPTIPAPASSA